MNRPCDFGKSFSYIRNTFAVYPEKCKTMKKYCVGFQCMAANGKYLKKISIKVLLNIRNGSSCKETFLHYSLDTVLPYCLV